MDMNQLEVQRELCSFDEKVALAELEESKASQRVKEIRYEKARFLVSLSVQQCKEQPAQPPQENNKG